MKFLLFYFEPGNNVLLQILLWLYVGQTPIESHLIHFKFGKADLNSGQKKTLQELQIGTKRLIDLDFTLLYALIQRVCGLAQKNDAVWDNRCPPNRQDSVEYMLYTLKTGRNHLAHPGPEMKMITELDVQNKCEEIKKLLKAILQKAGEVANVDAQEIDNVVDFVQNDLDRICTATNVKEILMYRVGPDRPTLKDLLLKEWRQFYDEQEETLSDLFEPVERFVENLIIEVCAPAEDMLKWYAKETSKVVSCVLTPVGDVAKTVFEDTSKVLSEVRTPVEDILKDAVRETPKVVSEVFSPVEDVAKTILKDASKVVSDVCAPVDNFVKKWFG